MNASQSARAKLFRTRAFREGLAEDLGLRGHAGRVALCLDFLLEGRRLPSPAQDNLLALATDGALIIAAVGSLQTRLETVLDVTDRLCAMTLQFSIDKRTAVGRTIANDQENASSFVTDFAELFREYWTAPRGAFTEGLCHTVVSVYKGDTEGNVLFGVLDRWSAKREQIYSSACLPVHGHSNPSASLPLSRGGSLFMPAAIANLAETLYARLDRTAGAIDVCA